MSVEAISWAPNLAPVPYDRGGKRNPACKAVLVGLANYAGPDGRDAFPLRTDADALRRAVRADHARRPGPAGGRRVIAPCDPGVVAAKIRRADQRPQVWALGMHLVRDDLDNAQLAALERQSPA